MIFLAHALEPQPNNPVRAQNNNKIITKPAVFLVNEFFLGIVYSCNFGWFLENYYKQIVQFLDWKLQAPNMFFKLPFFRLLTNVDTICNQASRGFHWFCFFTPFDWSRKLTLASRVLPANSTCNWLLVMLIFVLIGYCSCLSYGFAEHMREVLKYCP